MTESPNAFARGGASMNAVHAAKRKIKAQRTTTADVLRHFGAPPGLYVPCAELGGELTGNAFVVTFTRTTPGIGLDKDENLRMAFKHVKDQVAAWLDLNDRDPRIEWRYAQEKAPKGRVRIEVTDSTPGADRVVVLASAPQPVKAKKRPKAKPAGDPGEEVAARLLTCCPTCMSLPGEACRPLLGVTLVYGVHLTRARLAGIAPLGRNGNVFPTKASEGAPPRAPHTGVRKMAQRAQVPLMRCYMVAPWEQPRCGACGGRGWRTDSGDGEGQCSACTGRGYVGPMSLAHEDRVDGLNAPPSLAYAVPAEHRARWGPTITLYRRAMTARGLGTITVFDLKGHGR